MLLLEGSDTILRFRVKEIEGNLKMDLDLDEYDKFVGMMRFSDDRVLEIEAEKEENSLAFHLFGEKTKGKVGSVTMDIRGVKGVKKIRFNQRTIKGKILASIKIPNGM